MEERQNRFILFPMDEEEKSAGDEDLASNQGEGQRADLSSSEEVPLEDSYTDFSVSNGVVQTENPSVQLNKTEEGASINDFDPHNLEQVGGSSENVEDENLGELGVIQRDASGRIIFDGGSNASLEDAFSVSEEAVSPLEIKDASDFESVPESFDIAEKDEEVSTIEDIPQESSVNNAFRSSQNLQDMINQILKIDRLDPVKVDIHEETQTEIEEKNRFEEEYNQAKAKEEQFRQEIYDVVHGHHQEVVFKSDLLDRLKEQSSTSSQISMLVRYGEDYCSKDFVTNPAIGREHEIRELILTLLTPEKSAILIGKPGIGKTSIVEGLAYRLQRGDVPEALQGFSIVNIKTPSLIGTLSNGETRLQSLVDELKTLDHVILFIDEIHMLIGATNDSAMDFANMFKEGLGRGQIKIIGATTTEEYERYILRDKAFVRRFQSIEVLEPSREHTIKILMGTLPKIEKDTGARLKYTTYIQTEIMGFITDITSEYKRVYGIGSRYPDICLTLLKEAFSQCIFDNRDRVTIFDVRDAIQNSKNIYPDVIRKELPKFDEKFKKIIDEEIADDASIDRL